MDRKILKALLLVALLFLPIVLLRLLFGLIGTIIGIIVSFILCILIIRRAISNIDKIMLHTYKACPPLEGELFEIKEKVRILSKRANVATPSVCVTELLLPSSIIIGKSPDKTTLVIPARLLKLLDDEEIEALLAYNIVQINNSIQLRTLIALITGLFVKASSIVRWGAVFIGFGDYDDPAPRLFGLFIMGLLAPPAATIIHSVTKLDYDNEAVSLCNNTKAFISAIEHLENNNVTGYPSLGFMCLIDSKKENLFETLFNTHPPKEIRIEKLTSEGQNA
jgi:heat shock protein HtpX